MIKGTLGVVFAPRGMGKGEFIKRNNKLMIKRAKALGYTITYK